MKNWVKFSRLVKSRFLKRSPNLWWGDNMDFRFWVLSKLMDDKNKVILDIGCQAGNITSFLNKSNKLYGVDVDFKSIKNANRYVNYASFACASMYKLPYKNEMFDIVVMMNVIPGWDFNIEDHNFDLSDVQLRRIALNEASRVLKPNGRILITTPNGSSKFYSRQNKGELDSLLALLDGYEVNVIGWNNLLRYKLIFITPFLINNFLRVFSGSELLWKFLLKDMKFNNRYSKSIGVFARKSGEVDSKATISKLKVY
ncbi:class I SAM-dependent methyltransferase [Candidatus Thioglobus sp.]|nr:class I SAM-dependent methyltransferase [Candidatus Thioglobus sp.]